MADTAAEIEAPVTGDLSSRGFGEGPFPQELNVFNWNAFVWGGFWAVAYGVWRWTVVFAALAIATVAVSRFATGSSLGEPVHATPVTVLIWLLGWIPRVLFAQRANRLAWDRGIPDVPVRRRAGDGRITVRQFVRTQRDVARLGLALWAVAVVPSVIRITTQESLSPWRLVSPALMAVLIVVTVIGMTSQSRRFSGEL